jgi:RNA polymerase sigma-70 factor (ECF subfamily)
MKPGGPARDTFGVEAMAGEPLVLSSLSSVDAPTLGVEQVYELHGDFVWRTLQHLGARGPDLEDLGQEVFVTVHRKLASFDGRSKLTTWLFGICLHLVQRHRRRAYFRLEFLQGELPERIDPSTPETHLAEEQARVRLQHLLAKLSPERRATFVFFEIEGMSCEAIADLTGVPTGTVYSRLHLARKQVQAVAQRLKRRGDWE